MTFFRASKTGTPILVVDIEATCDDRLWIPVEEMETIEIGAVWALPNGRILDSFESCVRPIRHPKLTSFCTELTGIQQSEVDHADPFGIVMQAFQGFLESHQHNSCVWGSWGNYDRKQIEQDSAFHGVPNPLATFEHVNLKQRFASIRHIKQVGMAKALALVGLALEGPHHRALADAKNIARLLPWMKWQNGNSD